MNTASELYLRARKRCPIPLLGQQDKIDEWVAKEIDRLERICQEICKLSTEIFVEMKSHGQRLDAIQQRLRMVQRECPHEFIRGTAESDEQCRFCGYSEPEYRRS